MNFGKNLQHDFPKMRAVWNFSENSSLLVWEVFPKMNQQMKHGQANFALGQHLCFKGTLQQRAFKWGNSNLSHAFFRLMNHHGFQCLPYCHKCHHSDFSAFSFYSEYSQATSSLASSSWGRCYCLLAHKIFWISLKCWKFIIFGFVRSKADLKNWCVQKMWQTSKDL